MVSSHSSSVEQQNDGRHYFLFEQQQEVRQHEARDPSHHYFQLDKNLAGQAEGGHYRNSNQPPGGGVRDVMSQASASGHLTLPRGQLERARQYFELEKGRNPLLSLSCILSFSLSLSLSLFLSLSQLSFSGVSVEIGLNSR